MGTSDGCALFFCFGFKTWFYCFCYLKSCQWMMKKPAWRWTQPWSILSLLFATLHFRNETTPFDMHGTIQPWNLDGFQSEKASSHAPKGEIRGFWGVSDSTNVSMCSPFCCSRGFGKNVSTRIYEPWFFWKYTDMLKLALLENSDFQNFVFIDSFTNLLDSIISRNRLPILPNCHAFHWYLQASCRSKSSSLVV